MDQTREVDPLSLLEKISKEGISQDVCINDLGRYYIGISTGFSLPLISVNFKLTFGMVISEAFILGNEYNFVIMDWVGDTLNRSESD